MQKQIKITCNICYDSYSEMKCNICSMESCEKCIKKWSEKSSYCPQCKCTRTFPIEYKINIIFSDKESTEHITEGEEEIIYEEDTEDSEIEGQDYPEDFEISEDELSEIGEFPFDLFLP